MQISIPAGTARIFEKDGLVYGLCGKAAAEAVLDTVAREGLVQTMLAGIDADEWLAARSEKRAGR
jgi:hypothetical protein